MPSLLPLGLTEDALAAAAAETDPESLAASVQLRRQFDPDLAAAAVTQVLLRRRAVAKFGDSAGGLFFTRVGLEQATRPAVADHHAARLRAAGARRVVDLGCGIGADAMAFLRAGLEVIAVDRDPMTADVARANLAAVGSVTAFEVRIGTAEDLWPTLAEPGTAVFCDPARRTDRGRSWRVEDLSPAWPFVLDLVDGTRAAGVKLGPGLAHRHVPEGVEAEWVSDRGDTVELGLWAGPGSMPGRRSAQLVDAVAGSHARLVADPGRPPPLVSSPQRFLYEPLGTVVRSGGLATLAADLAACVLHPEIGYLTSDEQVVTPFATGFAVAETLPYTEATLRAWTRRNQIGSLEIKTRGLGLDPAVLRRRLKLRGPASATVVIGRTTAGPTVLVVERMPASDGSGADRP